MVTLCTVYQLLKLFFFLQYTEIFGKDSADIMETSSFWSAETGKLYDATNVPELLSRDNNMLASLSAVTVLTRICAGS